MKILKILRKKWLKHRVYKYTLKYNNYSNKSQYYHNLSDTYYTIASKCSIVNCSKYARLSDKFKFKGNKFSIIADTYLDKKQDLERNLHDLERNLHNCTIYKFSKV